MLGRTILFLVLVLVVGITPLAAQADERPYLRKWEFRIGGYLSEFDTGVRIDSKRIPGLSAEIDLEDDTGLDDSLNLGRLSVARRLGRRHQVAIDLYSSSRNSTRVIDRELEIGDVVFPVQAQLDTEFDLDLFAGRYTYWPVLKPKYGWFVGGGIVYTNIHYKAAAQLPIIGGIQVVEVDEAYPIPLIYTGLRAAPHEKVMLGALIGYLELDQGDLKAEVADITFTVEWNFHRNVGIGVGFSRFGIDVEDDDEFRTTFYDITLTGIQIFVPIKF